MLECVAQMRARTRLPSYVGRGTGDEASTNVYLHVYVNELTEQLSPLRPYQIDCLFLRSCRVKIFQESKISGVLFSEPGEHFQG